MSELQVLPGAEEFAFGEGPVGALLVHGFTGSPQSMRTLGEYLSERGIAVVGPRLPGHGTTWQDLNTRTGEEWMQTVETAFHHLASQTEEVFVVGLSFGGTLAIDLVARHQDEVAGLVTLAGMVFSKDPRRHLAPVVSRLVASLPGLSNDVADPEGKEIAYDRTPTRAAHAVLRFARRAQAALPQITTPTLVMHARQDHTVHPSNAQYIHDRIGSTDKELVWFDRSYHVITVDYEKDQVFERTFNFIKEHSKHAL
ncbi:MAG: carboxylesterase [Actinomycetota bacterium]|nr:carboxylesterase [Actinomycetota bacterium]